MITRRVLMIFAVLAATGLTGPGVLAANPVGPADFIRDMGREAIDSLTGGDISADERKIRFRKILNQAFDMPTIARFTLGRYWRRASKEQKEEYVRLFEVFIVQAYAARFQNYRGETLQVGKVQSLNDKDSLVLSEIIQPGGPPVRVNWRVRGNSDYRIVDVVVEGISMGITQRDEFASVIRNSGGNLEGLLDALRKKTGKN